MERILYLLIKEKILKNNERVTTKYTTMKFFISHTASFVAFFVARGRENRPFLIIFKLLHI